MFFTHKKSIIISLLVAGLTSGCSSDISDLNEFIEKTKLKHLGSVQPIPQFKPYQNFIYSATELRDPFEAAFETESDSDDAANSGQKEARPREPLENFPLDTLRMVGLLEQNKQVWGLIKDPQNLVHRVQTGNYAGQNEGQIVSVSEQNIELIEIISDGMGGYIERSASLSISDK